MIVKKKLEAAIGLLLAVGAWAPAAHAGTCVGSGAPSACVADGAGVPAVQAPGVAAPVTPPFVLPGLDLGSFLPGFGVPVVEVAPIFSYPRGQTYGHWAAQWWQWALEIPAGKNPVDDTDGSHCAERQTGDVWFLAGSWGTAPVVRRCTVPAGKALFFPLINNAFMAWLNDPAAERTDAFVRAKGVCSRPAQIDVTVDNTHIPAPTSYFTGPGGSPSPLFSAQLPVNNRFGYTDEQVNELALSPVGEQGYYLFLSALAAGNHRIRWVATGCTDGGAQDITYLLKVQ